MLNNIIINYYQNEKGPIFLGLFLRFSLFGLLIFYAFPYGASGKTSPLDFTIIDPHLYYDLLTIFFGITYEGSSLDALNAREIFFESYSNVFSGLEAQTRFPGPILPFFIWITDYSPANTFFLSFIVFLIECLTFIGWQKFITAKAGIRYSYLFALLPQPMWIGLIVTSDVFFYFFTSFVLLHILDTKDKNHSYLVILSLLAILSRPTAIIVPIFIILWMFAKEKLADKKVYIFLHILILFVAIFYYLPYFFTEQTNKEIISPVKIFLENTGLSSLDRSLFGLISLLTSIFFLFGIHPSESGLTFPIILRAITGIIFMLGLYNLAKKDRLLFFFCCLTILPILFLFYPAWRYLMPIIPIMFLYFLLLLPKK